MKVNFRDIYLLLLHTLYERKGAKRQKKKKNARFQTKLVASKACTTPNKRPIEMCTKNVVLKTRYLSFPVR